MLNRMIQRREGQARCPGGGLTRHVLLLLSNVLEHCLERCDINGLEKMPIKPRAMRSLDIFRLTITRKRN